MLQIVSLHHHHLALLARDFGGRTGRNGHHHRGNGRSLPRHSRTFCVCCGGVFVELTVICVGSGCVDGHAHSSVHWWLFCVCVLCCGGVCVELTVICVGSLCAKWCVLGLSVRLYRVVFLESVVFYVSLLCTPMLSVCNYVQVFG